MATELLKTITDLLNEEKWTRAALNSYSITNFKDLDTLIEQARAEGIAEEIRELAGEHLKHTSNSIIALYLSGVLALSRELVDDTNLIMLISIFMDNHKWNVVEFLAERILEYGENKYALRTLGECCENRSDEPKKLEIWDRLIRVDYEEADIVKILGEKREEAEDLPAAVDYYKKAIHRFINKKQFASVKELWDKLIHLSPEDIDFFFHIEGRIARGISGERAAALLTTLIPHYKEKEDWDTSIEILKKILAYDSKNGAARKDIIECYRQKYAKHSQLEEYIKISNLTQNWRNVHEALADFEKHIAFDTGNYVFHRTWGIGRISASKDDTFTIDFSNKSSHKMSLKMAVSALEVLSPEHIWVLKRTIAKEELAKKVKAEPAWALRTIIRSFGNQADMKKIKAELVSGHPERRGVVPMEHGGALHSQEGLRVWEPAGQGGPVRRAGQTDLLRGEDLQQVQGGKGLLRKGEDDRGLHPGRTGGARLGLVHGDALLLHLASQGLHRRLRDGAGKLAARAEDRRLLSVHLHRGADQLRGAVREDGEPRGHFLQAG